MNLYRTTLFGSVFFLLIFLGACVETQRPVYVEGGLIPIEESRISEKDAATDSLISIYREALEQEMNEILAYSAHTMSRDTPEGLLNNFVADLCFEIGQELYKPDDKHPIDFCLLNYGGLRASIPGGPVTLSNIFELMPFENEMVVITLDTERTLALFDYLAEATVGMPVSNIKLIIEDQQVKEVNIAGEAFDLSRNYKVLTSDYLAGGGDNMTFFLEPIEKEYLGLRIRDAIIEHLRDRHEQGKMIESTLDGRITIN